MGWVEVNTGLVHKTAQEKPALPAQDEKDPAEELSQHRGEADTAKTSMVTQACAEPADNAACDDFAGDVGTAPGEEPASEQEDHHGTFVAEQALGAQLLRAVRERVGRAEKSVLRSMAEQRGLPEEHLADLLAKARALETAEPAQQERQTDTAEERLRRKLLQNEVARVGGEMGLLDADVALRLLEEGFAKVESDGEVTGVRESLESLRQRKGYLFAPTARTAWAQRVGTAAPALAGGVEEAFYRKNPALRK